MLHYKPVPSSRGFSEEARILFRDSLSHSRLGEWRSLMFPFPDVEQSIFMRSHWYLDKTALGIPVHHLNKLRCFHPSGKFEVVR